jgi:hypothetical protein
MLGSRETLNKDALLTGVHGCFPVRVKPHLL